MISAQVTPVPKHVPYAADHLSAKEKRPLQRVLCVDCETEIPAWHPVGPHVGVCLHCQNRLALAQFVPHET